MNNYIEEGLIELLEKKDRQVKQLEAVVEASKPSIYILRFNNSRYSYLKLGYTSSIAYRLSKFYSNLREGVEVSLVFLKAFPLGRAETLEKEIHRGMRDYSVSPETIRNSILLNTDGITEFYPDTEEVESLLINTIVSSIKPPIVSAIVEPVEPIVDL